MENSSVIRPLVDVNISDKVFDVLKKAIQCGELKPGDVLIERDLAEKLGVSRTPVREAIQRLKVNGAGCSDFKEGRNRGKTHAEGSDRYL